MQDAKAARPRSKALLAVSLLALAHRFGILHRFAIQRRRANAPPLGRLGYLAFVASYALLQPFGVRAPCSSGATTLCRGHIAFALSMPDDKCVVGFSA